MAAEISPSAERRQQHWTKTLALLITLWGAAVKAGGSGTSSKVEMDYALDESIWNEESPVGEVERLLREHKENQDLVRSIGTHYYQIIYPVQLRHHEKMGISTREISQSKYPPPELADGPSSSSGGQQMSFRTGKHFHRTSLLIKAFNHKFRLDLELNTQLLAPNLKQKNYLSARVDEVSKPEIEHCYYHGTVKDYPGATAAFRTCSGLSGVIHVGNETFIIHPFYGGDLSRKHPHVIFEARSRLRQACGNTGKLEWGLHNYMGGGGGKQMTLVAEDDLGSKKRKKKRKRRDVREVPKYIETAIVIDKAMFEKRLGSTRLQVVHDAIQIANIADLYFRTLNTRVSVVYLETWQRENQAPIDKSLDISRALLNFNDYTSRNIYSVEKDTTQLLSGEQFQGGESGMAVPNTVCTPKSVGISVDLNVYEPHLVAGTMAHMIGHNLGMGHDDGREECHCQDWHGCIMAQSIVGLDNVQPYKFSECSLASYIDSLRVGHGICLFNRPNQLVQLTDFQKCGNGVVDEGEQCDCGTIQECPHVDPCCDPITCKLTAEAQCASGACCDDCRLRPKGFPCREAVNECDLTEYCTGLSGQCPMDVYQKNGNRCGGVTTGGSQANNTGAQGYCFNGMCPTLDNQCLQIWGYGGVAADRQCYQQFNSKGYISGHCGTDSNGNYIKCDPENVLCGSLQCQMGYRHPIVAGMDEMFSRTIISIKGKEYECKATSGTLASSEIPDMGLVRDGTPCGENLVCINQTCLSIYPYIDPGKCPSNNIALDCSGHGLCSNMNSCHCERGFGNNDCGVIVNASEAAAGGSVPGQFIPGGTPGPFPPPGGTAPPDEPKQTASPYLINATKTSSSVPQKGSNRVLLVVMLVSVVGGVFIVFALMALCYRRSTVPKYEPPYQKKPLAKKYAGPGVGKGMGPGGMGVHHHATPPGMGGTPHHHHHFVPQDDGEGNTRIITFGPMPSYRYSQRDHKLQQLKRHGGMTSEEEGMQSDGGGMADHGGDTLTEVERTLKSLNGYHEDILEALRSAASHRGAQSSLGGSAGVAALTEELRKSLCDTSAGGYPEYTSEFPLLSADSQEKLRLTEMDDATPGLLGQDEDDDDPSSMPPSCGPIRIRNLEDLIRQLEHHSQGMRHMSPSGSEDIRMSETEADRHYRIDSGGSVSSVVAASTASGSCGASRDESGVLDHGGAPRFVYGRYRQPTSTALPSTRSEDSGSKRELRDGRLFSGSRAGSAEHGFISSSSSQMLNQEAIYATAGDPDRSGVMGLLPGIDSESLATSSHRGSTLTRQHHHHHQQQPQWAPPQQAAPPPSSSGRPARRHFR